MKIPQTYDEVLEYFSSIDSKIHIQAFGIDDKYIRHGDVNKLKKKDHFDLGSFFKEIDNYLR